MDLARLQFFTELLLAVFDRAFRFSSYMIISDMSQWDRASLSHWMDWLHESMITFTHYSSCRFLSVKWWGYNTSSMYVWVFMAWLNPYMNITLVSFSIRPPPFSIVTIDVYVNPVWIVWALSCFRESWDAKLQYKSQGDPRSTTLYISKNRKWVN